MINFKINYYPLPLPNSGRLQFIASRPTIILTGNRLHTQIPGTGIQQDNVEKSYSLSCCHVLSYVFLVSLFGLFVVLILAYCLPRSG